MVRKGYDTADVRSFLQSVSIDLARSGEREQELGNEITLLRREVESMRDQLVAARHVRADELDEATVASLLGEEAARVLTTAREGAAQVRSRGQTEADATRQQAAADVAQQRADARAEIDRIVAQANADAAETRAEAERDAESVRDQARDEGRQMAFEARAYRERVLADLARRRDLVKGQLRVLDMQRQRLRGSFNTVRGVLDEITTEIDSYDADFPEEEDAQSITGQFPTLSEILNVAPTASPLFEPVAVEEPVSLVEPVVVEPEVVEAISVVEPEVVEVVEPEVVEVVEPELVVEPEVAAVAEASPVDDLFARIRASRSEAVAQLQEAPEPVVPMMPEPAGSAPDAEEASGLLDQRSADLAPIADHMSRRLKRVLADEQNSVFDELRRARTMPTIDSLLGDVESQIGRFANSIREPVADAALAGARSLAPDHAAADPAVVDRALDELAAELVAPLRERVSRAVIESGADAASVLEQLRSLYREVKLQRIDVVAGHVSLVAHGRGAFAALTSGSSVCWLVDPSRPCAEGDDNTLGGAVRAGDAFPTGHTHAPAYFGCRCAIAIAR